MLLRQLEAAFIAHGPGTIAAFVAEPVVGATAGALPPTPGYFRGVRALCDKYGILFIADEVMCGMGRCGTMLALEAEAVAADITTIAKGLAAGYQPIGAVLAQDRIADAIRARSGVFLHGHTYVGHACAAAAALAVQKVIERDGLLDQVQRRGATQRAHLGGMFGSHPHVGDIRGRGLLLALELVADRVTKRPFAPARRLHAVVKAQALQRGLIVYPMGGTIDGTRGDHVLLAPPFICSEDDLAEIARRLRDALDAALAQPLA
jgi:adenosylmethionine-8-amino-7-oxononanoate aminotransferase